MSNPPATRYEIVTTAANGNAAALEFLNAFERRAHWVDDIVDLDRDFAVAVSDRAKEAAHHEQEWLLCISSNAFFLAHRAQLVPAMLLALNAWVDSESIEWDSPDVRDVVKGQWHEVVWLVAWLTGGWLKLREVSGKYREYDLEDRDLPIPTVPLREEANGLVRS